MAELTPMKRQYYEIKQRNPDCLLFFRLGDFYEMFDDDARLAARELDLTLTTRDRNVEDPAERTPMCGVPYHSAEAYIGRLIAKGYKVAICEQLEDPALAKGLVDRDVIRIITPGTVTASSMLEENKSNYLCAVYLSAQSGGTAFCDLSTGEFCAANYPADAVSHILNELGRFAPREAVCADAAAENDDIRTFLTKRLGSLIEAGGDRFEYMAAAARVCEQFGVQSTDALGLGEAPAAVCAAGALLAYLHETQKCDLGHIRRLELLGDDHYMELDYTTRRNLELTENLRSGEKRGSLGAANIIVFLVLLVRLLSMQFTPFLFMNVYWPSVNIIQQCLAVLLPLLFFVAGNWGLTTLFEGKGTFKDVYIATCYALTPYVILQAAMILLANVITAKEGAFYYVLEGLSLGWSGVLIICGMMQTHDYSLGKTLLFTIMTLLAMVVIIFLLLLFFSLVGDGIGYFVSLYKEVLFRLY